MSQSLGAPANCGTTEYMSWAAAEGHGRQQRTPLPPPTIFESAEYNHLMQTSQSTIINPPSYEQWLRSSDLTVLAESSAKVAQGAQTPGPTCSLGAAVQASRRAAFTPLLQPVSASTNSDASTSTIPEHYVPYIPAPRPQPKVYAAAPALSPQALTLYMSCAVDESSSDSHAVDAAEIGPETAEQLEQAASGLTEVKQQGAPALGQLLGAAGRALANPAGPVPLPLQAVPRSWRPPAPLGSSSCSNRPESNSEELPTTTAAAARKLVIGVHSLSAQYFQHHPASGSRPGSRSVEHSLAARSSTARLSSSHGVATELHATRMLSTRTSRASSSPVVTTTPPGTSDWVTAMLAAPAPAKPPPAAPAAQDNTAGKGDSAAQPSTPSRQPQRQRQPSLARRLLCMCGGASSVRFDQGQPASTTPEAASSAVADAFRSGRHPAAVSSGAVQQLQLQLQSNASSCALSSPRGSPASNGHSTSSPSLTAVHDALQPSRCNTLNSSGGLLWALELQAVQHVAASTPPPGPARTNVSQIGSRLYRTRSSDLVNCGTAPQGVPRQAKKARPKSVPTVHATMPPPMAAPGSCVVTGGTSRERDEGPAFDPRLQDLVGFSGALWGVLRQASASARPAAGSCDSGCHVLQAASTGGAPGKAPASRRLSGLSSDLQRLPSRLSLVTK